MTIKFPSKITTLLLDIEGTVCPITFVKDGLFPYFLDKLPSILSSQTYPLDPSTSTITATLSEFPDDVNQSASKLEEHITHMVKNDIKEKTLKALQGLVWEDGYSSGEIKAPLYADAIASLQKWTEEGKVVYIYSSGSVKAQKLLFGHVDVQGESKDLNGLLKGYFDITTSGYKFEKSSYENILKDTGKKADEVLFLSDNVKEVQAALEAGMASAVVLRSGNAPLSEQEKEKYILVDDFTKLDI